MTSISFGAVAAPCCGARYLAPMSVFANLQGWREWSDGYGAGDRYSSPKSVCECVCGSLFLESDVSRPLRGAYDASRVVENFFDGTPVLPYLTNSRAGELVQCGTAFASPELEYKVRLFHWRALNHPRREWHDKRSRDWHEQGCWIDLKAMERDGLIAENVQRLLPIIEALHPSETLLLGEAHRILGHAAEATEYFHRTEFSYAVARERLTELVQLGDTRVIQIAPLGRSGNPQRMPEPRINTHPRGQIIPIQSRRYFFNPGSDSDRGRWALVDLEESTFSETLYFITDESEIREVKLSDDSFLSSSELEALGYQRWERLSDLWEEYVPPGGPFFIVKD